MQERYTVPARPEIRPVRRESLGKPVIFHDGRLVQKPTPLIALAIIVWFPIAVPLSILRITLVSILPLSTTYYLLNLLGLPVTIKGTPPPPPHQNHGAKGVVYVCSHRTLVDPIIVSACLRRTTSTITYSLAGLSEFLCPIKSFRLTRNRAQDAKLIDEILKQGNEVVMFPEGTTCREPYLLRFSSLFAELTDQIVPVAVALRTSMFYGNTARGYKRWDSFFLCMNPMPVHEITFLNKLPEDETCRGGKSIHQVANHVQELIGKALDYECTNLTRKDKYRTLAGTDGLVDQ